MKNIINNLTEKIMPGSSVYKRNVKYYTNTLHYKGDHVHRVRNLWDIQRNLNRETEK